jgi:hypothetical protein
VSTTDFSVVQRIDVPAPVGIDQMPDGKTIVVGTETQGIYLINEDTYAVQSFFISTPSAIGTILLPIIPAAMANGKVLFIGLTLGGSPALYYLEGDLYEWDPTTNSFTAPSSSISSALTAHLARSGDHKFGIFGQAGGGVFLYSSDTDSFKSINNGLFSGDVAGNADGSQFAVSTNGAVNFYDRNLNLLSSVTLPTRSGSPTQEVAPFYGMQYSPDDSTVYIQATDVVLSPFGCNRCKTVCREGYDSGLRYECRRPCVSHGIGQLSNRVCRGFWRGGRGRLQQTGEFSDSSFPSADIDTRLRCIEQHRDYYCSSHRFAPRNYRNRRLKISDRSLQQCGTNQRHGACFFNAWPRRRGFFTF